MRISPVIIALMLVSPLSAQTPVSRVLVPLYLEQPVHGAFDSVWVSYFSVHNASAGDVHLAWCAPPENGACILDLRHDEKLAPGETQIHLPARYLESHLGGVGAVLYASSLGPGGDPAALAFQLRIADTSRQATSAGTEIPVIREAAFLSTTARLLSVPTDPRFRPTLRVYEMDLPQCDFAVRVYEQSTGALVREHYLTVRSPRPGRDVRFEPAYAEIGDLIGPVTSPLMRVEVVPLTEGAKFWTFISMTNNETQHVTLFTPQ